MNKKEEIMLELNILEDVIKYKRVKRNSATHFVLCNREKIRYFICLNQGKNRLTRNLSTYSIKLTLLMKLIKVLPFRILEKCKLGYFAEVEICKEVQTFINNTYKLDYLYNIIVGTYDKKQKIVIQLYSLNNKKSIYYKIGNEFSDKQMKAEINFLSNNFKYKCFYIPTIIDSQIISDKFDFNIQITEEFNGTKVKPKLTKEIYNIFRELSTKDEIKIIDNIPYTFSHGDFAPWNIRKDNKKYILFDWEHCGVRFYGFDLIHFVFNIEYRLRGNNKENSIDIAINKCKEFDAILKEISSDKLKQLYLGEFYGEM